MATRNDFDDFFGDDDDVPVTDTRADGRLYRVPLTRLAPNLVNPRKDFGTEDELIDFGKSLRRRQNQACPVVSRNAYLKLWPEHRDQVKDVDYILVSGERRYRAAHAVALPVLDCIVNDDFAADRKTFMEAVVSENVDRQNFDAVEEAYAVQALVSEFGTNRAVAQHFERADGWVTQRVQLTYLAADVQELVRTKKIPLEHARKLGMLARDKKWDAAEQLAWWAEEQGRINQERTEKAAAKKAARAKSQQSPPAPSEQAPDPAGSSEDRERPPASSTGNPAGNPASSFTAVKLGTDPQRAAPPATLEAEAEAGRPDSREATGEPRQDGASLSSVAGASADAEGSSDAAESEVPGPRQEPGGAPEEGADEDDGGEHLPPKARWKDGLLHARLLIKHMDDEQFELCRRAINEHAERKAAQAAAQ